MGRLAAAGFCAAFAQLLRRRDEVEQDASDQNRKKETLAIRWALAAGVENII
jgi:hypothetical protein